MTRRRRPPRRPTDVTADRLIDHCERLDLDGRERDDFHHVIDVLRQYGEDGDRR